MSEPVLDEEIAFRHVWQMDIVHAAATQQDSEYFNTIYGPTNYEWTFTCGRPRTLGFFRAGRGMARTPAVNSPRNSTAHAPHPIDCTFTVRLIDKNSVDVLQPVTQVVAQSSVARLMDQVTFRSADDTPLGIMLQAIYDGNTHIGKTIEVVSVIRFPMSDFALNTDYERVAQKPPKRLDFRFNCITDTSRHDFTIVCRDGRITYPKDALFHVSPFFREILMGIGVDLTEDVPMTVAQLVLNFMLTETFDYEGVMSVDFVRQLFEILNKYRPTNKLLLKNAIERHLIIQLGNNTNDLHLAVRLYLLGCEFEMNRLQYTALSLIITIHYGQFSIDYGARTPENSPNHELIDQLSRRPGIFRPAPLTRINQTRRSIEHVNVFRRQVQAKTSV